MRGWNFRWASEFQQPAAVMAGGSDRFCIVPTPKQTQLLALGWRGLCGSGGGGCCSAMSFPLSTPKKKDGLSAPLRPLTTRSTAQTVPTRGQVRVLVLTGVCLRGVGRSSAVKIGQHQKIEKKKTPLNFTRTGIISTSRHRKSSASTTTT
jgi:hypothetical protein